MEKRNKVENEQHVIQNLVAIHTKFLGELHNVKVCKKLLYYVITVCIDNM